MGSIDVANLNSLDLNLIRVFDALLRERSATRAGERIGLSQPAVSAALNRLRHAFNDQLFVRNGNEMVPTPRAESLAEPVRSALATLERAFEPKGPFDPAQLERTFTLLGADFFSMLFMPQLSAKLAALAPKVKLRLLDSARGDVAKLLQDDAIDVAGYVIEHLALEIDPFPRKPGAEFDYKSPTQEESPFAVLKNLKTPKP